MKRILPVFFTMIVGLCFSASAQITNVKFTDLKGKSYDLYALLSEGKYVLVHCMFNS
jgi:hypothetical protein